MKYLILERTELSGEKFSPICKCQYSMSNMYLFDIIPHRIALNFELTFYLSWVFFKKKPLAAVWNINIFECI